MQNDGWAHVFRASVVVCSEGQINAACCHWRDSSTPSNTEQMDHRGLVVEKRLYFPLMLQTLRCQWAKEAIEWTEHDLLPVSLNIHKEIRVLDFKLRECDSVSKMRHIHTYFKQASSHSRWFPLSFRFFQGVRVGFKVSLTLKRKRRNHVVGLVRTHGGTSTCSEKPSQPWIPHEVHPPTSRGFGRARSKICTDLRGDRDTDSTQRERATAIDLLNSLPTVLDLHTFLPQTAPCLSFFYPPT